MKSRYRLRRREDIQAVRRRGKSVHSSHGVLCYRPKIEQPPSSNSRFCFTASKRVGNAVQRNRAKRLMREVVRLHLDEIEENWDCVLIAKAATASATYAEVEAAILRLFSKAELLKTATN